MTIKQHKVVVALPIPLEPDSIYYVRNGGGFDIHVTNNSGVVVGYELNASLDKVDRVVGKQLSDENYTFTEKQKLVGIADEATKNRADSENADKVHTHTTAQVTGLDTALSGKASTTDPRFTDAREWTASTITQAEAEAGAATTRRAFTAQRVRQAIVAWFNGISGALGRTILTRTTAAQVRSDIGLRTAAIRDVGLGYNELIDNEVLPFAVGTANLPRTSPTLNFNFMKVKHLDPRIEFTRGSTATYTDALGNIRTAANDEPRFTYDPATGEALGMLLEEQRTNLSLNSADIRESIGTNVTLSATTSPDGSVSASLIYDTTGSSEHYANDRVIAVTAGATYTWSAFVKDGPSANRNFYIRAAGLAVATVFFNPRTKVMSATSGDNAVSAGFQELADGWFRVWLVYTATSSGPVVHRLQLATVANGTAYQGDGVSGLYMWGRQLEEGSYPSSYIPTEGAQVTRAADHAYRVLGEEWNPESFTLLFDFVPYGTDSGVRAGIGGDSFADTMYISYNSLVFRSGGEAVTPTIYKQLVDGVRYKVAISISATRIIVAYNGVIEKDVSAVFDASNIKKLVIGGVPWGDGVRATKKNEFISSRLFPRALSEAELQELTK